MFHLAAYSASLGAGPDLDTTAPDDQVFVTRNNHLIFTQPLNLLAVTGIGALITRQRFNNPQFVVYGINHIWPLQVSATIPNLPLPEDLRDMPVPLPQNEELVIQSSNSAAGPTQTHSILWLGSPDWNRNWPSYSIRTRPRATVTVAAGTAGTWNNPANIVMERDLLNGVYAMVGCTVVAPNAIAFRVRFPDMQTISGRQFRPGGLVQNAAATLPWDAWSGGFGEWGRFHTFTLPQIQTFGDAAGGTYEVRLDLLYLGQDENLLGVH